MNLFHESKKILDKDGKVNPLGPYGRQKLTGREVSTYFRRNPVKDAQIKKAVEVALDLQGAMTVASKEIKKFYGDKILRSKEVQKALKYANESVEHDIREDLQEVALGPNMLRKDFPNVWATKDAKLYRVLAKSISQDGFIDNLKAYKRDKKKFVDDLKKIAKNPKKYEKSYGRNFSQYINNPKPGQNFAKLPESINENYRKLAQYGMGTETSKSARVGLELDFYDEKGNKQFGKILQKTNTGYLVKDDKGKKYVFKYHDRVKAKKMLKPNYVHTESINEQLQKNIQEEVRSVLGEAPYDKADVKKVKVLEKKLRNMLKEVDKTMRGSGLSAPAFSMVRSGITKGLQSIEKFYKIANKDSRKKVMKNPRGYVVAESLNEVTDKEINMAKKLSKDMEKVKKGYQQIAKSGDKTLKNTGFNPTYEAILQAQQKVLSLIGELNTMKMMSDRAASRQKDAQGRPFMGTSGVKLSPYKVKGRVGKPQRINSSFDMMDTYRDMQNAEHCELVEGKVLKFTKVKDKSLEKHLKVVTKKVGAKLEKISGGFAVSDTDMRGFTAVVDYIFDKSIKKNMLDGGGMSDVNMVSEDSIMSYPKKNEKKIRPMLMKIAKKHPKVKVSFGTHSKGKFVDDNNINFKGQEKDIDMLMKDIQNNHKNLVKMMESPKLNLNVMDEYAKMYEDAVQKAREKQRLSDTHKREKEALAKKHARMKEQKELDEGMMDLDKARKLPDNIQKQILDLKKEYDRTWDGVFVPMGKEGSSQRKEYERRGKLFKAASKKYKDFLKKHKVATFK